MNQINTFLFLIISSLVYSQDFNFKPNWKVGEIKVATITNNEKEFKKGSLIKDTTTYNEIQIKVLKENKENYTLEILFENVALKSVLEIYQKLGEELTEYKNMKLIIEIDKKTAVYNLVNWKEAQDFMIESFDQIERLIDKKIPEMASITSFIFMPIKEIFKNKESIEDYIQSEIDYILIPFNKDLSLNETIIYTEKTENPFSPMQNITSSTYFTLTSMNEKTNTCTINQSIILDLSEFKEMMKSMMQRMSNSFGANDSITKSKSEDLDLFEMDMTNEKIISFDYKSTWVKKVVATVTVTGNDPKEGKRKSEIVSTVIIN